MEFPCLPTTPASLIPQFNTVLDLCYHCGLTLYNLVSETHCFWVSSITAHKIGDLLASPGFLPYLLSALKTWERQCLSYERKVGGPYLKSITPFSSFNQLMTFQVSLEQIANGTSTQAKMPSPSGNPVIHALGG